MIKKIRLSLYGFVLVIVLLMLNYYFKTGFVYTFIVGFISTIMIFISTKYNLNKNIEKLQKDSNDSIDIKSDKKALYKGFPILFFGGFKIFSYIFFIMSLYYLVKNGYFDAVAILFGVIFATIFYIMLIVV